MELLIFLLFIAIVFIFTSLGGVNDLIIKRKKINEMRKQWKK